MIRGTRTRTQTDKEADRRSGSEAKEQRAEEAFGTPGDRGGSGMRKGREDGGKKEGNGCWQPACSCTLALHETRGHSSQTNANRTYGNTRCASVWDSIGPETMIRLHEQLRSSCILWVFFPLRKLLSHAPSIWRHAHEHARTGLHAKKNHFHYVAYRRGSKLSPIMHLFYSF